MDTEKLDNFPFPKGEYHPAIEVFDAATEPFHDESSERKRGGRREGSGRKKLYEEPTVRLKCRLATSNIAKAFINSLNSLDKKEIGNLRACKLDGSDVETRGKGMRKWTDEDAIESNLSLKVDNISYNKDEDSKIFALAFVMSRPSHVSLSSINESWASVTLRWQSMSEVTRLMMLYASLLTRKNRLTNTEKDLIAQMPENWIHQELKHWIEDYIMKN